jgi:hypothetical protein
LEADGKLVKKPIGPTNKIPLEMIQDEYEIIEYDNENDGIKRGTKRKRLNKKIQVTRFRK